MWQKIMAGFSFLSIMVAVGVVGFGLAIIATAALWATYKHASVPHGVDAAAADFNREYYATRDRGTDTERVGTEEGGYTPGCMAGAGAKLSDGSSIAWPVDAERPANNHDENQPEKLAR